MQIFAKLKCRLVEVSGSSEVVLLTHFGDCEENRSWAGENKSFPAASVSLVVSNPDAKGVFVPGREYLVSFTPCEDGESA